MKTIVLSAVIGLLLTFTFTQLNSQVQNIFEGDDYTPPHPDSLSDFIDGMEIQLYDGGEAYVIKDKNIYLPDAIELAKDISDIYGTGYNAVPKVFDTSIKQDKINLPPLAKTAPLAGQADTSLCNQIIWSEPMLLFEGKSFLSVAVSGDTVHAVAGFNNDGEWKATPYRRSIDGGITFEPIRNVYHDTVGRYNGGYWTRILTNGKKIFISYSEPDTLSTGALRLYYAYTVSTNGGNTFTPSRRIVDYPSFFSDVALSSDTIVVVVEDNRWIKGKPSWLTYIYISTNFGETWKFRGYAGGRRVHDTRIAFAGGWLQQVNNYFPPGRWTRHEVAHYRSRVMRKTWSRRQLLSTNDGISSIQGDPVAEPNGFVGVIWNDGKYGSNFGVDGTPIFRRSLNFGKTFEPEVRLTDAPEAAWTVMRLKSISSKMPIISTIWAKFLNWPLDGPSETINTVRLSLDVGSNWCEPINFGSQPASSGNTVVGNDKIYVAYEHTDVYGNLGCYFVYANIPPNLNTSLPSSQEEEEIKEDNLKILTQNYPNPFNPATTISYNLTQSGFVTLKVYDVLGREVAVLIDNEYTEEGDYEKEFLAERLPSGIYYYRISISNENGIKTESGKMILMK